MSTGLECHFIERAEGEWYYLLQDGSCPVQCWDWREYATAYGPFKTEDEAHEHLSDNHANPGGSSSYSIISDKPDPVLEQRFAEAFAPQPHSSFSRGHYPW